ncbi:MAG: Hsp20/alpha crystallin family protein [Deltaproteobacteria bacterium]|nr:Hsp20/alpha crystallin family protein [Deltaproteobacteria bacterium]
MESLFDQLLFGRRDRRFWPELWRPSERLRVGGPVVDVYEQKNEIVVKTELPGMSRDDIQINITDNVLTITGEKKKEEEVKEEDYYRRERTYGRFSRALELPKAVQIEKAQAIFKNGVLDIRIPKTEEAKRKEIEVKIE